MMYFFVYFYIQSTSVSKELPESDKISGPNITDIHTTHTRLLDKRIVLSNQNDILHENFHNNAQFNTADNNNNKREEEDEMEKNIRRIG